MGELKETISTISGIGASPTEIERYVNELLNRINGNNRKTLKVEVKPSGIRKLNSEVFTYIRKQEYKYTGNCIGKTEKERKWDYYTLTYVALLKLKFVFENGKLSQERYCQELNIRRPTLTKHYQGINELITKRQELYEEIERGLFFEEYRD